MFIHALPGQNFFLNFLNLLLDYNCGDYNVSSMLHVTLLILIDGVYSFS